MKAVTVYYIIFAERKNEQFEKNYVALPKFFTYEIALQSD